MSDRHDLSRMEQVQIRERLGDRVSQASPGNFSDVEIEHRTTARVDWLVEQCPYGAILDVGCGEGAFAIKAAHDKRKILAIDLNREALEKAKDLSERTLEKQLRKNIQFEVRGYFESEDISPEFDAIIFEGVVERVYAPAQMLRRAVHALLPGGRIIITASWGYVPASAHHQTLFLSSFLDSLPDVIRWDHLDIMDGDIRFSGTKPAKSAERSLERIRSANRKQFDANFLLALSEQAALEAQRFLQSASIHRSEESKGGKESTGQLSARVEGEARSAKSVVEATSVIHSRWPDVRADIDQLINQLRELERTAAAERDALNERIHLLEAERDTLRKRHDLLERSKGDIALATRTAIRRRLEPLFGRVRAYVEARPALKARLLRNLPKSTLYSLKKYARGGIGGVSSSYPNQTLKTHKISEGHKIVVLCNSYPDGSGHYGGEFIRARLLAYRNLGFECLVVVSNHRYSKAHFKRYEGIDIFQVPTFLSHGIFDFIGSRDASTVFVHSPSPEYVLELRKISKSKRVALWFHGYEARDYRRLLYNFSTEELELQREFLDATNRSRFDALLSLDKSPEIHSVFVSNFLLNIARSDSGAKLQNSSVIHNFVDGEFFSFRQKSPEMARKILLIRSFQTRNYANDIATDALKLLSQRPVSIESPFNSGASIQSFFLDLLSKYGPGSPGIVGCFLAA